MNRPALDLALTLALTLALPAFARDIDLGETKSPHKLLDGKHFKLKAGERLRFFTVQPMPRGGSILTFEKTAYEPTGQVNYSVQVADLPGQSKSDHVTKHTFTIHKRSPARTIKIHLGNSKNADYRADFTLDVQR